MSSRQDAMERRAEAAGAEWPVWWLVFKRELAELWIGGRALNLLILFSVLMSITAFLLATNNELSLTPPKLTVVTTLQATMTFGLFIGLVIAAESITGERERATLEPLLLTPTNRREIVFGKFVAALSPWPVAMILAIPYLTVLSQGDPVLAPALLWGAMLGTLVTIAFTGVGMLASIWSASNRTSLFVSLLVYLLALLPAQLPGEFQATPVGALIQATNPLEAVRLFLQRHLVEGQTLDEVRALLVAPTLVLVAILALLLWYAAPRLGLERSTGNISRLMPRRMEATR
ncbi:MAG: ABC transporter permease [Chloroflexota bacterium]|nr:ABC transporter permease [Chloroflexota bacterium]